MHDNSRLLFARYGAPYLKPGMRVLEIGPDRDPSTYRRELGQLDLRWETADLAGDLVPDVEGFYQGVRNATYLMPSEYEIPVADGTFDAVVAGNVVEHVRKPWLWLPELARVTKPGGRVVVIAPVSWPYHAAPYDCWRVYPDGMSALCEHAELEVKVCTFEALEQVPSKRTYQGQSYNYDFPRWGWKERVKGLVGWPVPTAVDIVAVAEKPLGQRE